MSTTYYTIHQHVIPVPRVGNGTKSSDKPSYMAVKQYATKTRHNNNGLTLVAAHANACVKELYEPLWDSLHESAAREGVTIASIWMADVAYQGESGVLNESAGSDEDVSLTDHARDLLTMIDHFKEDMLHPIVGLGHSMGGISIIHLSLIYPDVFTGIVLVDPMIQETQSLERTLMLVKTTTTRRDRWPSRDEARRQLRRARIYGTWDADVFEKYIEHGLRRMPKDSEEAPCNRGREVSLMTPTSREVLSMVRPSFTDANGIHYAAMLRPEPRVAFDMLKHLQPDVLFLLGEGSHLWQNPAEKIASSGFGTGPSQGKVTHTILEGCGHYAPMESPRGTANAILQWIVTMGKNIARPSKL